MCSGGVSIDPDQVYVGGHIETEPLVERLVFRPNVEIGFGGKGMHDLAAVLAHGRERKEQQRGRTTSEGNEIHGGKPGGTPGQF